LEVDATEESGDSLNDSFSSGRSDDTGCFKLFFNEDLFLEIEEGFSPLILRKIVLALSSGGSHGALS
jgi:hypothetical protein